MNFLGESIELQRAVSRINKYALARQSNSDITKSIFIPPASPHMGERWERPVRSVKTTFTQITIITNLNELLQCRLIELCREYYKLQTNTDKFSDVIKNTKLLNVKPVFNSNGIKPIGKMMGGIGKI